MDKLSLRVNGNRVLVRYDDVGEMTSGGLYVPMNVEKEQRAATVVDAPLEYVAASGVVASPFRTGDRVLVDALGAMRLVVGGETLYVVRHDDVIGRLVEE